MFNKVKKFFNGVFDKGASLANKANQHGETRALLTVGAGIIALAGIACGACAFILGATALMSFGAGAAFVSPGWGLVGAAAGLGLARTLVSYADGALCTLFPVKSKTVLSDDLKAPQAATATFGASQQAGSDFTKAVSAQATSTPSQQKPSQQNKNTL